MELPGHNSIRRGAETGSLTNEDPGFIPQPFSDLVKTETRLNRQSVKAWSSIGLYLGLEFALDNVVLPRAE